MNNTAAPEALSGPTFPAADLSAVLILRTRLSRGASWFRTLAALSPVNSVMQVLRLNFGFVFGLTTGDLITALGQIGAEKYGATANIIAFAFTALVSAIVLLFFLAARNGNRAAFVGGMVLYTLDGGLAALAGEWLTAGFHLWALFGLFQGAKAAFALHRMGESAD